MLSGGGGVFPIFNPFGRVKHPVSNEKHIYICQFHTRHYKRADHLLSMLGMFVATRSRRCQPPASSPSVSAGLEASQVELRLSAGRWWRAMTWASSRGCRSCGKRPARPPELRTRSSRSAAAARRRLDISIGDVSGRRGAQAAAAARLRCAADSRVSTRAARRGLSGRAAAAQVRRRSCSPVGPGQQRRRRRRRARAGSRRGWRC